MIPVRQLKELCVSLPTGACTLSLAKCGDQEVREFLDEMQEDFLRKVAKITSVKCFSVLGGPRLIDERIQRIFVTVLREPYENDKGWQYQVQGSSGILQLVLPEDADVNIEYVASARTTSKSQEPQPKVLNQVSNSFEQYEHTSLLRRRTARTRLVLT